LVSFRRSVLPGSLPITDKGGSDPAKGGEGSTGDHPPMRVGGSMRFLRTEGWGVGRRPPLPK